MILNITKSYDVTNCKNCPYLQYKDGYCNGGFGDLPRRVPVCKKGCFGKLTKYSNQSNYTYWTNEYNDRVPNTPPSSCPLFNTTKIDDLANMLGIDKDCIEKCFAKLNVELVEKQKE